MKVGLRYGWLGHGACTMHWVCASVVPMCQCMVHGGRYVDTGKATPEGSHPVWMTAAVCMADALVWQGA